MALVNYTFTSLLNADSGGQNTVASEAVEVRFQFDATLATIYSDSAGASPIAQLGAATDANGILSFWALPGYYTITAASRTENVVIDDGSRLNPLVLSDAQANIKNLKLNETFEVVERTSGNGGGAKWKVIAKTTENGFDIVAGDATRSLQLIIDRVITPEHLGVFGDSSTDVTTGLQAYANYCILNGLNFTLSGGKTGTSREYKISSAIAFSQSINITSIGDRWARLICVNCDTFTWNGTGGGTPNNIQVEKIRIAQATRHTTTPNTYRAFHVNGNAAVNSINNIFKDIFIDGFGLPLELEYVWGSKFTNINTVFCGKFIKSNGISANNKIYFNDVEGNLTLFDVGDGTNQTEGWHINNNLLNGDSVGLVGDFRGAAFFKIHDNICDFMGAGAAILIRSVAGKPSIGHDIRGNYIAFNGAGTEGIRMLNNVAPSSTNTGNKISENTIFAYPSGSLIRGILTDGTAEENNIISYNSIEAGTEDISNSVAVTSTIAGNKMLGAGFATNVICEYYGNEGIVTTSEVLLKKSFGKVTEYFASSIPTTGSYFIGDTVHHTAPSIDGNNMTIIGWKRLTTGSGHVLNTDWAAMYISTVSPAT